MRPDIRLSALNRLPRQAAHVLIRSYQLSLSAFIGRQCRHEPTCSAYMDEAIARHGVLAGGWLGAKRLCRCHPWGTSGYDPVPETIAPSWLRHFSGLGGARSDQRFRCQSGAAPSKEPRP
jgi:hypothetical protein